MNEIRLVEVNKENFGEVVKLSKTLTKEQAECVAPNVYSIAEAHVHGDEAWMRAVYLDEKPIGFVMLSYEKDDEMYNDFIKPFVDNKDNLSYIGLWRFMMAGDYQGKGYGKKVLDLIVNKCKEEGIDVLCTSCVMAEVSPYNFYIKYGFEDTGIMDDDEEILLLKL
jgi:diamine N-acetyltransferase